MKSDALVMDAGQGMGLLSEREKRIAKLPVWGQEFCRKWGVTEHDIEVLRDDPEDSEEYEEVTIDE